MPMDFLTISHSYLMDSDRIPVLLMAIVLTSIIGVITGAFRGNANPFLWGVFDALFGRVGDRMDRLTRPRADLIFRGFLLCTLLLLFVAVAGYGFERFKSYHFSIEVLAVALSLTSGSVWYLLLKLYFALDGKKDAKGGYYGLSRSTRVDLNSTDDYGITREGVNFAVLSFDKGLVAPGLWYLIGGVPVLFVYSAISFAAWRFGKCGFTKGFGAVPLALEKIMGVVPSLFSGFLFSAATAVTPSAKLHKALFAWWGVRNKAPYEEGGLVLSAVALPLEIGLGGAVRDISGSAMKKSWVGADGASVQVGHKHLRRVIYLNIIAHLLYILGLLSAYVYAGKLFV